VKDKDPFDARPALDSGENAHKVLINGSTARTLIWISLINQKKRRIFVSGVSIQDSRGLIHRV
jgi:hypothetical protein